MQAHPPEAGGGMQTHPPEAGLCSGSPTAGRIQASRGGLGAAGGGDSQRRGPEGQQSLCSQGLREQ